MKQILALPDSVELQLLKDVLEGSGIRCALRNEQLAQALPATPFNVELWVSNDDDFQRAQGLCQAWLHPPSGAKDNWACPKCGQQIRGQFDSCWKCGANREKTSSLHNEGEHDENVSWFVD